MAHKEYGQNSQNKRKKMHLKKRKRAGKMYWIKISINNQKPSTKRNWGCMKKTGWNTVMQSSNAIAKRQQTKYINSAMVISSKILTYYLIWDSSQTIPNLMNPSWRKDQIRFLFQEKSKTSSTRLLDIAMYLSHGKTLSWIPQQGWKRRIGMQWVKKKWIKLIGEYILMK